MKIILFITLLLMSVTANAMDLTVEWEPTNADDYYIIHYGEKPRLEAPYTNKTGKIIGTVDRYTFSGLEEKVYYFGIKTFNTCGNSSDFSKETSNGKLPSIVKSVMVKTCVTYHNVDPE